MVVETHTTGTNEPVLGLVLLWVQCGEALLVQLDTSSQGDWAEVRKWFEQMVDSHPDLMNKLETFVEKNQSS